MKKLSLTTKILIGFGLGILVGLILFLTLGEGASKITATYVQPFGTLFLNLIKMTIAPLVFSSLVVGACGLGDVKTMGRVGGKTMAYFLCTTAFAVVLGLLIGNLFRVGGGELISLDSLAAQAKDNTTVATAAGAAASSDVISTLLNIIPTNVFAAFSGDKMLQIIAFALFVGGGIVAVGKPAEPVKRFFEGFAEVMYKIIGGIMILAPYAVLAMMINIIATYGPAILAKYLVLIIAVYLACLLHAALVYSGTLMVFAKYNPLRFFKRMIPAMTFAFTSASSSATLPFTMEGARKCGVPLPIRSFVLPLGATINMDGTAAFQGICALFIANAIGMPLTLGQQAMVVLSATLASIGTAGVPGAGTVMLGMVLSQVGLPVEGIILILGVDRILDMVRTMINITGDAACSVVIAKSEHELIPEELIDQTDSSVAAIDAEIEAEIEAKA